MNQPIIYQLLKQSRCFANAKHSKDLLALVAKTLTEIGVADSGFFVFQKSFLNHDSISPSLDAYEPFGEIVEDFECIAMRVREVFHARFTMNRPLTQWMSIDLLPQAWSLHFRSLDFVDFGIWPLYADEHPVGAIVVFRGTEIKQSVMKRNPMLMDICAAQMSLALDLVKAVQSALSVSEQDWLTGLLNRRGLEARLPAMMQKCVCDGDYLALGFVDVDNLKVVNDTRGHLAGDRALQELAQRIREMVRSDDLVARVGGDEFAIVLRYEKADAAHFFERLQHSINQSSPLLSVSVGVAVFQKDGDTVEECFKIADERMYANKVHRKSVR
jgi:diguanylate cyclase (GGDEF)-like protein